MRIVHFAHDEKFLPLIKGLFEEAFPGCNTYLIPRPKSGELKFLAEAPDVRLTRHAWFRLARLWPALRRADMLVVHSMTPRFARALRSARPDCVVVWIGYGFDYYGLLEAQLGPLLLDKTRRQELERASLSAVERTATTQPIASVAARIDVFSVNPSEVELLRKALPALRAAYHVLPSFTAEDVFDRGPTDMTGPDILLGNSATPSNNHLEAFDALAPLLGDGRQLLVPLSYGGKNHAAYADRIAQAGSERFGERFIGLRTWMPLEAYNARMQRCGFVVMNHRRQQAVGNIGTALYKGAKVFLRPENPLFGFYAGLGAVIHSTEALEARDAQALAPLPEADRLRNREVVLARWGRAQVLAAVRGLAGYRR